MTITKLFEPKTIESAPEGARETLQSVEKAYGFVPNLLGTMANSPATLKAYVGLDRAFNETTLSQVERQVVLLAASAENDCGYCQAAHATVLKHMLKVPSETVDGIRDGADVNDSRLAVLADFTREVVRERGHVPPAKVDAFLSAGFSLPQVMEVVTGVAMKTLSNYLDHLSPVEVDGGFAGEAR